MYVFYIKFVYFSTIFSFLIYDCQKAHMFLSQRLIYKLTTKNVTYVLKFSTWQLLTRSSTICKIKSLVQEHGLLLMSFWKKCPSMMMNVC